MLVLTLAFLVILVLPVVVPGLPPGARQALDAADTGIWAAFLAEYLARLLVAPSRLSFIVHNPFDLLLVVVPVLRPLRLLRSLRLIRAARVVRVGAGAGRAVRESRVRLASRAALLAAGSAAILVAAAAVMVLDAERSAPEANITGLGDALWWAMSTVTTVGYGDRYPVTAAGRAVGMVLMITGVGIFGVVAASAAAWFMSAGREQQASPPAQDTSALTAEIAALRDEVRELRGQVQSRAGGEHGGRRRHPSQRGSHGNEADVSGRAVHRRVQRHRGRVPPGPEPGEICEVHGDGARVRRPAPPARRATRRAADLREPAERDQPWPLARRPAWTTRSLPC
jgi:voltage-gated potassium channel